jgi:adenylylsulfate reductase subunit A
MANFETVTVETDLLILGGGMASCGAAVEAAHWAKKNNLKVIMVDKAAVDRSGAVAMGLSAINQYVGVKEGDNTIEDYVKYVKQDLMGVARDDLVASIARHVDGSVHLFEKWGLPIWKAEDGSYVHEGRWQLMINGESYKVIVAEAAKNNLGTDNIYERIFIVGPIMEGGVCKGAYGFSVREDKFYVFKARAVFVAMGGAVHVFKPRSSGEGLGRAWYPPWNSGSSAYFTLKAGAEMTCQEVRFIPVRFKDAYGPVGAWFLLFKSRATNAFGGEYMVERRDELENWKPYGRSCETDPGQPPQLARHARRHGGQGPDLYADCRGDPEYRQPVQGRPEGPQEEDEGARERGLGRLPRHDHLAGHSVGCQ